MSYKIRLKMVTSVIGITGKIASGKTWWRKNLAAYLSNYMTVAEIDLDSIRRHALWESTSERHERLRIRLADILNLKIEDSFLNREIFTKKIFESNYTFNIYRLIVTPVFMRDIMDKIHSYDVSIIEWTLLVEDGYDRFLTHPPIYVDTPDHIRMSRLQGQPDIYERLPLIDTSYTKGIKVDNGTSLTACINRIGLADGIM